MFWLDGIIFSVFWDWVYFMFGRGIGIFGWYNWDVRGLILDVDGVIVWEMFVFCIVIFCIENVYVYWEFLWCYMEEGLVVVVDVVYYCMLLDGKCGSFVFCKECIFVEDV